MKIFLIGFMLAAAAAFVAPQARAADDRDVTVINGTGYEIKFLGFNNPGDNDWSENELDDRLDDGDSIDVTFDNSHKGCVWNFKIEWADPGYPGVVWQNIDLCTISEVTLKYDRRTDKTTAVVK